MALLCADARTLRLLLRIGEDADHGGRLVKRRLSGTGLCRGIAIALIGWVLLLVLAPAAGAHAFLLFSDPAFDDALSKSPETVNLVFSEAVDVGSASIVLSDSRGQQIEVGSTVGEQGGSILTTAIGDDLSSGIYQVAWDVTGDDGHGAAGEFRFAVGTALPSGGPISSGEPTDWTSVLPRWLLVAAFAIALGGLVGQWISAPSRMRHPDLPRIRPWSQGAAMVGLASVLFSAAVLVRELGGVSALFNGPPGWRVIAEGAGFVMAWYWLRSGRERRAGWALIVVAGAEGYASHSDLEIPVVGMVLTGIHLVAAGIWIGALLHVVRAAITWREKPSVPRELMTAYARLAAKLFAVVVATGSAMALLLVPFSDLTTTTYGRTLLLKIGLVALVAGLAVVGRWALRRRARRLTRWAARTEVAGLALVLASTAVLVSTANPGSVAAAPPPAPMGIAVPAGGLAGQIRVNAVASEGQLVVRLSTPQEGNAYDLSEPTSYALTGSVAGGTDRDDLDFRSCGDGCFVASHRWADGDNVLSLRADAAGWRGGQFSSLVAWPAIPAGDLLATAIRSMRQIETMTIYETGTSEGGSALPPPYRVTISGDDYVESEPFGSGIVPVAVSLPVPGGGARLLLGFPAARIFVDLLLDGQGRITDEVFASPKHLFRRRFVYEPDW